MPLRLLGSRKAGLNVLLDIARSKKERLHSRRDANVASTFGNAEGIFHK
ncbi:hypothetical protein [Rhodomicrobium vannielii]|nr:hypothetical protein [Rhodomicrobium vannielii]